MTAAQKILKPLLLYVSSSGLNMLLRGLTLGSKFVLMLFLARTLTPSEVGTYGLFAASISYALYFAGMDFYTYSSRDILSRPREVWAAIIRDQGVFYLCVYLFAIPLLLLIFSNGLIPWSLAGWFYLILVLDHACQEGYRLMVVIGRPLLGGWALFLRMGSWAYVVAALFWFNPSHAELDTVWWAWFVGELLSLSLVIIALKQLDWSQVKRKPVDWGWMRRGMRIAFRILVGTIALRGMFTFDRYLLESYHGLEAVGVYSLFMGMAVSLQGFVDSGVMAIYFPKVVSSWRHGQVDEYHRNMRATLGTVVLTIACFAVCAFFLFEPLLTFIGKDAYLEQGNVFWWLVLAQAVFCLGLVPHLGLAARFADRVTVCINLGTCVLFLLIATALLPKFGLLGLSWAILAAMIVMASAKTIALRFL